MAVRSNKNQFRGINPHLNSFLQLIGDEWQGFHNRHIGDLTGELRQQLRPLGYTATMEQSVQIRRDDEVRRPRADVAIFDPDPIRPLYKASSTLATADQQSVPITTMLSVTEDELAEYRAIAIYRVVPNENRGDPVVWIELLSPSNKPGGTDFEIYDKKRKRVLQSGIVVVELDYLHQSAPTVDTVMVYRQPADESHGLPYPYRIVVLEPRPDFANGQGRVQSFGVDQPLPTITIPLSGDDRFDFDFDPPYQKTFTEMVYGMDVDYSQPPANFTSYIPRDQITILKRMLAILQASQSGTDLETWTLPDENDDMLEIDDAMRRLDDYRPDDDSTQGG